MPFTRSSMVADATTPEETVAKIRRDPWTFIQHWFGEGPVFDKQRQILEALRDFDEVLVPSCHDSGKTWSAARALMWFLFANPKDSIVLSTAPTFQQVAELLWREVSSTHAKAKFALGGRLLQTKYELGPKWFATGITSDDPVNYQGYHAQSILVILDEADGIKQEVWDALEGVLTSGNAKLLAIGNPLDPTSQFAKRVKAAQLPKTKVIRITANDVLPHTDGGKNPFLLQRAWVEDKKEKWGETSALYRGKILAEWPDQNIDTLIPIPWLIRAKARAVERGILTYGVDVARFGSNRTVRTMIAGNQFLWSRATEREDTTETASRVISDINRHNPSMVQIDETGIGGAVLDQVRKQLPDAPLVGVNNGGAAQNPVKFVNRAAEMWWSVREAFEKDQIGFNMDDPESVEELINDLNRPTYSYNRKQQLVVDKYGLPRGTSEYGLSTDERAAKSPDRGDSYVLAFTAARPFIQRGATRLVRSRSYMPSVPAHGIRI